jgi:hypothetical protein
LRIKTVDGDLRFWIKRGGKAWYRGDMVKMTVSE